MSISCNQMGVVTSQWWRRLMKAYEWRQVWCVCSVTTVWSIPERFRGELVTMGRYTNLCTFTFMYLVCSVVRLDEKCLREINQLWRVVGSTYSVCAWRRTGWRTPMDKVGPPWARLPSAQPQLQRAAGPTQTRRWRWHQRWRRTVRTLFAALDAGSGWHERRDTTVPGYCDRRPPLVAVSEGRRPAWAV